jgi:hypothetical protein
MFEEAKAMERILRDVGENPTIIIHAIGGDLRVSGRDGEQIEALAPEKGELKVEETKNGIEITCRSGCLLFVPRGSLLEAGDIGGDGRLTDVLGEVLIKTIGGDANLRRLGKTSLERIGGDAQIREVEGTLMIDHIGGDAVIRSIKEDVLLRMVGGDLLLGDVTGSVEVMVGGDAVVNLGIETDTRSKIHTGSDLSCQLPKEPSVNLHIQAGGQVHVPSSLEVDPSAREFSATIGEGAAEVELRAGADLNLQYGMSFDGFDTEFVGDILTEVDAKLAEMEARFNAMGAGMYSFDADRIGERVRRSVRHAQRQAKRAVRKAEDKARKAHDKHLDFKFDMDSNWPDLRFADFTQSSPVASDEERLAILQMVESGKISVDEAEGLLKALEGES